MKNKLLVIGMILMLSQNLMAWDHITTHPEITETAINDSEIDAYLISIGIQNGVDAKIGKKSLIEWIKYGATEEDKPKCRATNHFHDPTLPWDESELTDLNLDDLSLATILWCNTLGFDLTTNIKSNIFWATGYLSPIDNTHENHNDMDWKDARDKFYTFLTGWNFEGEFVADSESERQRYLSESFQALGQVLHLLQDMAVPAHTRNDFSDGHNKNVGWEGPGHTLGHGNKLEAYVARQDFKCLTGDERPYFTDLTLTNFWDTDQYDRTSSASDISAIDFTTAGLAEFSNANFITEATFNEYFSPFIANDLTHFDYRSVAGEDGNSDLRAYLMHDGHTLSSAGYFTFDSYYLLGMIDENKNLIEDEVVQDEYARLLIPPAIGYSAELLNYFFRGRMQLSVLPIFQGNRMAILQVTIKNDTLNETIGQGEYKVICRYKNSTEEKTITSQQWTCYKGDCGSIPFGEEITIYLYFNMLDGTTISINDMQNPTAEMDCTLIFKGTLGGEADIAVIPAKFALKNTGNNPYLSQSILFNEEWDSGLTGANSWVHTAQDDPNNYPNGTTVNTVESETLQNGLTHNYLFKQNIRGGDYKTPRFNESILDMSTTPITTTRRTWLEFKIDDMSVINTTKFEHQALLLFFNNGITLQLSQENQALQYLGETATWMFGLGENHCLNIFYHLEAEPYNILLPEPLEIENIHLSQQIYMDDTIPGVDFIENLTIDYIRVVEELIIVPSLSDFSVSEAQVKILGADLQLGTVITEPSDEVPAGKIIRQEPESGTGVPINTYVNLIVSSGAP